ncbi:MAG: hypothetical protein ACWA6Y_01710 [Polaromonas sp.]
MKKSFQKTLIAASVGGLLAVASMSASAINANGTTNLLFPYVNTATSAYTFVTVVNRGDGNAAGNYHFYYGTKAIGAANSGDCDHQDGLATTTANDVMQFEVRKALDLPTIFGDTTSKPYYYTGGTGRNGFLIVNSAAADNPAAINASLYGEAVVIDTASGLRMAYSSDNLQTLGATANSDFSIGNVGPGAGGPETGNSFDANGDAVNDAVHMVSWYQTPTVSTSWFVAPLGLRSEMTPSAGGGLTGTYNMYDSSFAQTGAYDNNENFNSGAKPTSVKCVGVIQRSDILFPGALANTNNGGFSNLATTAVATDGAEDNKSLVYKVQSTSAVGSASTFVSRETIR